MENNDFEFTNLPVEAQDKEINASDFKLVDNTERVHEQKFMTKPTTFFKDSVKRFSKNKSSVVAAGILGTLLLLSVFVPIFDTNDIEQEHPKMAYLEPKLFNGGSGFWDGTRKLTKIAVDVGEHADATTEEEKQAYWWPAPEDFKKQAVSDKKFTDVVFTSEKNKYAQGGYVQFGISGVSNKESDEMGTYSLSTLDISGGDIYLKSFDVYDLDKLKTVYGDKAFFPENYVQGKASLSFNYYVTEGEESVKHSVELLAENSKFDVSNLNVTDIIKADAYVTANNITEFKDANFSITIKKHTEDKNECVLIKSFELETTIESLKDKIEAASFTDANEFMFRAKLPTGDNANYWECTGNKKLHMAQVIYCDFTYDSYEAVFGIMEMDHYELSASDVTKYKSKKWCKFEYNFEYDAVNEKFVITDYTYEVLDERCPLREITKLTIDSETGEEIQITGMVDYAKYYGYDSAPRFILGTDKNGRDMFKYVFEGLRTSLLLGIVSFIVCFIIALLLIAFIPAISLCLLQK